MLTISHAIICASIATKIPNPAVSLPAAFVLHFLCDLFPHWDVGVNRRNRSRRQTFILAFIDVLLAFLITFILFFNNLNPGFLLIMIFVSTLPDWIEAPYLFLGWNFFPFGPMYRFQAKLQTKTQLPLGFFTQLLVVSLFYFLSRR